MPQRSSMPPMASQDFPGFQDDPSAASAPPAPSAPPAQPPPLAAYAFEDDDAPAAPAPAKPVAAKPALPTPAPAARAPLPPRPVAPPAPEPEPEDVVPGSGKDLWTCPHCGSGNKPQRTTCRSCGKSPQDAVAKPWFLRPVTMIAAVAVVVVVLAAMKFLRADLSLHPADAAHVDKAIRSGGGREPDIEVDGRTFTPRKQMSVVGRVVATRAHPSVSGVTTVVLALGADAKDVAFEQVAATFNGERTEVSGGRHAVVHLLKPQTIPERGGYFSVAGRAGDLAEGMHVIQALDDGMVVLPGSP